MATSHPTPGSHASRAALAGALDEEVRAVHASFELDLGGLTVLTEAATGIYSSTAALAALAGAEVFALTRSTSYGTAEDAEAAVRELARCLRVEDRIRAVVTDRAKVNIEGADIVTNSGHVRPIDRDFVAALKPTAVIPLMYESWERRPADVDIDSCRKRRIAVAGTNEAHSKMKTFAALGKLAALGLERLEVPVSGSRLLLLCDNPFGPPMCSTLERLGARVKHREAGSAADFDPRGFDAIVLALTPEVVHGRDRDNVGGPASRFDVRAWTDQQARVVQVWGDCARHALPGVRFWPERSPRRGHMGMLLTELGPRDQVRLQAGGLKVGELMARGRLNRLTPTEAVESAIRAGFAQPLAVP